jgi:hypothetical protein
VKEAIEKPPCKIKKKGREGTKTNKISHPKKTHSFKLKNKGGAKASQGFPIKQILATLNKKRKEGKGSQPK